MNLTLIEQKHVRTMLRVIRLRIGTWAQTANALQISERSLKKIRLGQVAVNPIHAFKIARFMDVSIDELLAGRAVPDGTCSHCGHAPDFGDEVTQVGNGHVGNGHIGNERVSDTFNTGKNVKDVVEGKIGSTDGDGAL